MIRRKGNPLQLPTTRVFVCEAGHRSRNGWLACEIDKEITFDTAGLECYCWSNWEPVVFDALLLAAAIDFCDRLARRPALRWGRDFVIQVPVHEPDRWAGTITDRLLEALSLLTGDRWEIHFRHRKLPVGVPRQGNFDVPNPESPILPFSDGLDSAVTSVLVEHQRQIKLTRVRLGSDNGRRGTTRARQAFAVVPYKVRSTRYRFAESTARSRGFKFAMLSGVASYLTKSSEIIVPESGQGAFGPALVPVGQGYEDYRSHPRFTSRMEDFLAVLFGHRVQFSFPRLWYTKGQSLKEFALLKRGEWLTTRSCWQQSRQVSVNGHRRQCGICAACMLRRLSVHAAGLTEPNETYVWERLEAGTFEQGAAIGFDKITPALKEYAIAGTLHLDHLAALTSSPLHAGSLHRHAIQIAPVLGLSPQETEGHIRRMLDQHATEWSDFIVSLGSDSFITRWTDKGR